MACPPIAIILIVMRRSIAVFLTFAVESLMAAMKAVDCISATSISAATERHNVNDVWQARNRLKLSPIILIGLSTRQLIQVGQNGEQSRQQRNIKIRSHSPHVLIALQDFAIFIVLLLGES